MKTLRARPALGLAIACIGGAAFAQSLPQVTVTANPLNPDEPRSIQPATVIRGAELDRRRETSLGATLSQQPGVQDSGFGTAAGRPVVRGFDGPRVGVTQGGLDALDVSSLSPDHAVAIDPLSARSIEVLRGPATLLYGGGAIGGLVNVATDRIPTTRLTGLRGEALLSGDSASNGYSAALGVRGGAQGWNWTANAFGRDARDYRIPGYSTVNDPDSASGRLPNSYARADGAAAGASYVGSRGVAGVAVSDLSNRYGVPSEQDVYIRMNQQRIEALGELDAPLPGFAQLRARWAENRYRHDEVEGPSGVVGTAIRNRGTEGRVELLHLPLLGIRGVLGAQLRSRALDVSGEEAYVPSTSEKDDAFFYVGERTFGASRVEFGWRTGRKQLDPEAASGLPSRRFSTNTFSLGVSTPFAAGYALLAAVSSSQRAPVIEELYSDGPHAATATWETGNPELGRERSANLELAVRKLEGSVRWKLGAYSNRFSNYIYGQPTDANGDGVADRVNAENEIENSPAEPQAGEFGRIAYAQAGARFYGLEAELQWQPAGSPFSVRAFGDLARGSVDGFGNAPRMSPSRVGVSLDYRGGPWSGFVSLLAVQQATRLAPLATPTDGYLRLDAEIAYTLADGPQGGTVLYLQGRNLLNDEIRLNTSYIKDVAPQPGRGLVAGVRARF